MVKFELQMVQKVELMQELQLEGQVTQTEEERMNPGAHSRHDVEFVQLIQLEGQEGQLLPVK